MGVGWRHHSRRVLVLVVATAVALILADECQGRHGATADKRDLCLSVGTSKYGQRGLLLLAHVVE